MRRWEVSSKFILHKKKCPHPIHPFLRRMLQVSILFLAASKKNKIIFNWVHHFQQSTFQPLQIGNGWVEGIAFKQFFIEKSPERLPPSHLNSSFFKSDRVIPFPHSSLMNVDHLVAWVPHNPNSTFVLQRSGLMKFSYIFIAWER
jgi:hypothetical protein